MSSPAGPGLTMLHRVAGAVAGAAAVGSLALGLAWSSASAMAASADPPPFSWQRLESGTHYALNNLDVWSADVAWTASLDGQVLKTVDGGDTFSDVTPGGLNFFLDIEALSAKDGLLLVIGGGPPTRILRTGDGGATWSESFRAEPTWSLKCMTMFDRHRGFAVSDPVDGKFQIIVTGDGGRSWQVVPAAGMPDALEGEVAPGYAGDCASATGRSGFFSTAFSAEAARVFRTVDFGVTWEVSSTEMAHGIFNLDFRTNRLGLGSGESDLARTTDGGLTWEVVAESPSYGDLAFWSDLRGDERIMITDAQRTVFAVSLDGSSVSVDRGKNWQQFDPDGNFINVECVEGSLVCWASGNGGLIAKLSVG